MLVSSKAGNICYKNKTLILFSSIQLCLTTGSYENLNNLAKKVL